MIDVSVLYCGLETPSTPHRYGRKITQIAPPAHQRMAVARSARERRPIVVWNLTRTCNLKCVHCYTDSEARKYPDELTTEQCKAVLDDLAARISRGQFAVMKQKCHAGARRDRNIFP